MEDPTLIRITEKLTLLALLQGNFIQKFYKQCENNPADYNYTIIRDNRPGYEGWTLLHHAAVLGNTNVCAYLIDKGHAIDVTDTCVNLVTPLMMAIYHNNIETACKLVEFGASLDKKDIRGENGLHYAARVTGIMIKRLIKAGKLNREEINRLTSETNVRRKLPEDIAVSEIVKETIIYYRTIGHVPKKIRNLPLKRRTLINPS